MNRAPKQLLDIIPVLGDTPVPAALGCLNETFGRLVCVHKSAVTQFEYEPPDCGKELLSWYSIWWNWQHVKIDCHNV